MRKPDVQGAQRHLIGRVQGAADGPTLVAIGGVHGNEPAGVEVLETLLAQLHELPATALRGRFMALRGNVAALERGVRFIDEDMNRIWAADRIQAGAGPASTEAREAVQLRGIVEDFLRAPWQGRHGPRYVLDLHSFSAPGDMFGIARPDRFNLDLFGRLGIPLVVGIEHTLAGTAFHFFESMVDGSFVIEGGPHAQAITRARLHRAVVGMLEFLGLLDASTAASLQRTPPPRREHALPGRVRPIHRHPVGPEDRFVMRPGFGNLQPVRKGEWLADDRNGPIHSPEDGYILMPLYQAQGSDGFFIAVAEGP